MNDTLTQLAQFHGHLGPYAVIGYRMGVLANKNLGSDPFEKKATVWTGTTPPLSCIVDGIQFSSGCTLGKGTITIKHDRVPQVQFCSKQGQQLTIKLLPHIQQEIDTTVTDDSIVEYAERLFEKPDQELFEII